MSEVREGLICPMCMKDLGTIAELSSHFETAHPGPEADSNEAIASFKEIFAKAKKKLLNEDRAPNGDRPRQQEANHVQQQQLVYNQLDIGEQLQPGFVIKHSDLFRKTRSDRLERYNMQINKLVIRLSKLLASGTPIGNDKKRREFEQKIVEWVDETLVSRCPTCAENFTPFLGRRKHHCRLCGAITCQDCSRFVENALAQQLLQGEIGSSIPVLQLRCCTDCFKLLHRKQLSIVQGTATDHLQEAYARMKDLMDRCVDLKAQYVSLTDALMAGDGSLTQAQELRMAILKHAEKADTIAKRIGDVSSDPSLSPRQAQLRMLIRAATSQFVKDLLVSLPHLPEAQQLERLAQQRREEAKRRVDRTVTQIPTTMVAGGWTPSVESFSRTEEDEDPLRQQIKNIRGFLEQARAANKMDEVEALTENLHQLEAAAGLRS
ncbi:rabenosyn-5 [Galendromus occidentalis]|uniref:Rabenosyn-5 n=1 Tax=Galendromus occidentalis TaxID=34638 RepID=A0AAJ6QN16_9ACAR|nr:rabenosyn-5 [Galendromus occidentalis]